MKACEFEPKGVCARRMHFELEEGRLHNVQMWGGCPGNSLAVGKLVEGRDAREVVSLLKGNDCGGRGTSCADQLARAVEAALGGEEGGRCRR